MAKIPELQNIERAMDVHASYVNDFLAPDSLPPNVVGLGVGEKWERGRPSGRAALIAFVTHKVPEELLAKADLVPKTFDDVPTDVIEVGNLMAQRAPTRDGLFGAYAPPAPTTPLGPSRDRTQTMTELRTVAPLEELVPMVSPLAVPARRERPAYGGVSVGHYRITAGTLGTCVYDLLPGSKVSPPVHGQGVPARFYILSNNHVLANSNAASPGDPILQPGPYDGGTLPDDRIATLARFVPITFEPPIPRAQHRNLIDAAIAQSDSFMIDRKLHWLGAPRAWRPRANVKVGLRVRKFGRTTGLTMGSVIAVNATVDVGYGSAGIARFMDQIVTTSISAGGDSGSLVVTEDNVAIGLLFAGSSTVTILNQIENVRALLRVEVAETIG